MGWFGYDVMGGDPPMDVLGTIAGILKVPNDEAMEGKEDPNDYGGYMLYPLGRISKEHGKRIAKALKKNWHKIETEYKKYEEKDEEYYHIFFQVLAVLIMASGATFPRGFRDKCNTAARNDEWANREPERRKEMNKLIDAVADYKTGNQTFLEHEGLFEKIAKKLS